MKLLGLCCGAAELVDSGHLFRAHQALTRIRTEHFRNGRSPQRKPGAYGKSTPHLPRAQIEFVGTPASLSCCACKTA